MLFMKGYKQNYIEIGSLKKSCKRVKQTLKKSPLLRNSVNISSFQRSLVINQMNRNKIN